jgi:hypothetical protein
MKEIGYFSNEYLFVANCLILLCYLQTNMLMLRFLFIAGNMFFLIFCLTAPVIRIDSIIFNISFILINVWLTVPLINNLVPPHFTKEQREIFKNHFKNYLTPKEVEILLSYHRRKIYKVSSQIEKMGNEFSSLYFIVKIGKNCSVYLKSKKRSFDLHEYSWVGVPEYLNVISRKEVLLKALKEFDTGEWGANLSVSVLPPDENVEDDNSSLHNEKEQQINVSVHHGDHTISPVDEDNTVIIYEFDLRNMDKIFTNKDHGLSIMRGLHSIWLKYCSEIVRKVDLGNLIGNVASISGVGRKFKEVVAKKKANLSMEDESFMLSNPDKIIDKNMTFDPDKTPNICNQEMK